jgi:hypothetical protein
MCREEENKNMLAVSQSAITKYKRLVDTMTGRARKVIDDRKKVMVAGLHTLETSAAAFVFGLAQGKWGGVELGGFSLELIVGIVGTLAAFTAYSGKRGGISEKTATHILAISNGALASYFNSLGRQVGYNTQTDADRKRIADQATKRKKQYATMPGGQYSFGMSGETGGAALADEELARMVAAGRR